MAGREERDFAEFNRTGAPEALGRVFDAVAPELHRIALHLSPRPTEAEDLVQATFLAAIQRAASYDESRPLLPWLLGILANQARLARWRDGRRPDPERVLENDRRRASEPLAAAEHGELRERIDQALRHLPEAGRGVLLLRLEHGLTIAEIAESLGRPPGTVRSQLARGLEAVRRTLPAGLAGSAALVPGSRPRGLGAVRRSVLSRAAAVRPPAPVLTSIPGALLVKKVVLLGVGALLAGLSVLATLRPDAASAGTLAPDLAGSPAPREGMRPAVAPVAHAAAEPRVGVVTTDPARPATAAPATAREPVTASVLVEATWGESGEPAEGASILARSLSPALSYPDERLGETGADGTVRIDGLVPGPVEVGALRSRRRTLSVAAGEVAHVRLRLLPGKDVQGLVVSGSGEPVADAGVWLAERFDWLSVRLVARTDADGRFHLRSVGRDQLVGARHPDFAASGLFPPRGGADEVELRIVLGERGTRVRGRVLADDGRPVERASVMLGSDDWSEHTLPDGNTVTRPSPLQVLTDPEGCFEITSAPLGATTIRARAQGFGTVRRGLEAVPGTNHVQLVLVPQSEVRGRVTTETGEPVGGATVRSLADSRFARSTATSAPDGSFVLRGLSPGENELEAVHADRGRTLERLVLSAGQRARWDPVLFPRPRVFGRVVDEAGAPLAEWGVVLRRGGEHVERVETGTDGGFAFVGIEDATYGLQVKEPGDWRRLPVLVVDAIRPGWEPVDLVVVDRRLERATIRGVVRAPRGGALEAAEVGLWHEEERLWCSVEPDLETGAFVIDGVPPGTCHVTARAAGLPRAGPGPLTVDPGASIDVGTIQLAEPARVAGSVLGGDDAMLSALVLELYRENELMDETVTLAGRTFRSEPLAAGDYQLVARGDGLRSRRIEVALREGEEVDVSVRLERAVEREVVLVRPSAAPLPRWIHCRLVDASGAIVWMATVRPQDDPPRVRVSAPPGVHRFTAYANNGLHASEELEIGPATSVELRLTRGD